MKYRRYTLVGRKSRAWLYYVSGQGVVHNRKVAAIRAVLLVLILTQFSSIIGLLVPPKKAEAAALSVVSATSETQQTTTNTTATASDTSIASGSLPSGTWFVAWGAGVANSGANNTSTARLVRGSTEIAAMTHETMAASAANQGNARSGYWLGTLSGSEALTIEYFGSAGTTYIDSKFIKAIRLDTNLTADADYFTSGSQESSSDEVTNAGSASWTDVKTLTKTFSSFDTEEYLVLASMEVSPDSTLSTCSSRIEVDGSANMTAVMEGEDAIDQQVYAAAKIFSIGTGSKSIKLQAQSNASALCDYRRSRIYVFRASVFDQLVEDYSPGENTLASTTWTDKNTKTYTPNQSETVMVMGSRMLGSANVSCTAATRIDDGTSQYVDTHAYAPNATATDYGIGMSAASLSVSSAKTFKIQYQRAVGSCTVKIKESTLIVWSMTLRDPAAYNQSAYRWFDDTYTAGGAGWWDGSWANRRKITLSNSQSSENLVNFPIRVSLVGSGGGQNIDYTKTQNAGQDMRFIDADGSTVLKHEIENWNESGTSEAWVKVPQIDSGSNTDFIWMYYNNPGASDGQDAANVWDSNYQGVWHMKETSGTTIDDPTSNNRNGTKQAATEPNPISTGPINGAQDFDGSNDNINIGNTINLAPNSSLTFSAWVNVDNVPAVYGTMISKYDAGTAGEWFFNIENSRQVAFERDCGGFGIHSTGTVTLDTWTHITGTFNGTALVIYINGSQDNSGNDVCNITGGSAEIIMGASDNGAGVDSALDGLLDEVRVSNTARSGEWVEADYKTQNNQMNTFASEELGADFTPLAAADTAHTLSSDGEAFRLRLLLHVANNDLPTGSVNFKLQYAIKSGTCDTGYSGETYGDVGTASGDIRYTDLTGEADNSAMTGDSDDPTHGSDTIRPQTHEEANNLTSISRISRGEDGKWEFALVDFSASGAVSYCFRVVKSDGSAIATPGVVPEITTTSGSNTAPSSPTSLAQKKTDDTVVSTGSWTNESSIKLTATVTDSDGGDTVKICAEVDPIGTAFSSPSGDGDGCSTTGVSTGGTATVTISGLSGDTEYHWQIKAKDAAGAYSSWVTYGGNTENPPTNPAARDFGVDTSAPTGGTVYDGTTTDVDKAFSDTSLSALSANWSGFSFTVSGISKYEYSIGTTAGGTDIKGWTDNSTNTSVTATSLTLQTSKVYFVNVRASDNAGNTVVRSSDGQLVAPSLSFSISPATVTFSNLNTANSYTDTEETTVTTSTNAYGGYVVRAFATDLLRSSGNFTIGDFSGGTYASPDSWQGGDTGFGYTSSDTSVQGSNKFQNDPCPGGSTLVSPGCYAPFTQTKPGDIIADHTSNVTGSPISGEAFTITLRATATALQQATHYQAALVYAVTPIY